MRKRLGFPCQCEACRDIPDIEAQLEESVRTGKGCLTPAVREHPRFKVRAYYCLNCLKINNAGFVVRAPRSCGFPREVRSRKGYVCAYCQCVITPQSPYYEAYESVRVMEKDIAHYMEAFARGEPVPSKTLLVGTERGGEV